MDIIDLWEAYSGELISYLRRTTRSTEIAEDISSEIFLRAVRNQGLLAEMLPKQCRSWLYTTAKRVLIDIQRKRKLELRIIPTPDFTEDDLSVVAVADMLTSLPEDLQELVAMTSGATFNILDSSVEIPSDVKAELLLEKIHQIILSDSTLTISLNQQNALRKKIQSKDGNISIREYECEKQQPDIEEPKIQDFVETKINCAYYKL